MAGTLAPAARSSKQQQATSDYDTSDAANGVYNNVKPALLLPKIIVNANFTTTLHFTFDPFTTLDSFPFPIIILSTFHDSSLGVSSVPEAKPSW